MRRIIGLAALTAACAAFVMGGAAASAQTVNGDQATVAASTNGDYYGETDGYETTTTMAPTTTTAAPTTTTAAPTTTTAAPTTTVVEATTTVPVQVQNVVADPARPKVATQAAAELASTGVGSGVLAALGLGAILLGVAARRASARR